jgi:hypothetical protein
MVVRRVFPENCEAYHHGSLLFKVSSAASSVRHESWRVLISCFNAAMEARGDGRLSFSRNFVCQDSWRLLGKAAGTQDY